MAGATCSFSLCATGTNKLKSQASLRETESKRYTENRFSQLCLWYQTLHGFGRLDMQQAIVVVFSMVLTLDRRDSSWEAFQAPGLNYCFPSWRTERHKNLQSTTTNDRLGQVSGALMRSVTSSHIFKINYFTDCCFWHATAVSESASHAGPEAQTGAPWQIKRLLLNITEPITELMSATVHNLVHTLTLLGRCHQWDIAASVVTWHRPL